MAVPKKKTSKARRNTRRSANFKINAPDLVECKNCHARILSHRVCPKCGFYDGKKAIIIEEKK